MRKIDEIILFLSGKEETLIEILKEKMNSCAMEFKFEDAAIYRDKIKNLSQYPTLDPLMYLKTNNQNNSPHFKSIFTATNFIRYYIFSCSPQLNTFCSNPIFYRRDFNRSKCKMYRVRNNLKYYLNQKR